MFLNGQQSYGFTFTDEVENPLPANAFEIVQIGKNVRGMITDVNMYESFFSEKDMITWTTSCNQPGGEIFAWDAKKLNTTQEPTSLSNVTIIKVDKKSICPDATKNIIKKKTSKTTAKKQRKRFQPKTTKLTFVSSVLELFPGSNTERTSAIALNTCFRLNGELMPIPQTQEEERLMDKTLWDYMMKKSTNNLTYLIENYELTEIWVAGQSEPGDEEDSESRELFYPPKGIVELFHPVTRAPLQPYNPGEFYMAASSSYAKNTEKCILCNNSLKKRQVGSKSKDRLNSVCGPAFCSQLRRNAFICVFDKEPTFTVRGLCKNAVMDTQYKLAEHREGNMGWDWIEGADPREYVGPKGWIISQNKTDGRWSMSHYHYTDLRLTMIDNDIMLPVGRHKWRVENNACNEGETSSEILLLSGCDEGQFTCDDGKCLEISQRCNGIEV